MAIIQVVERSVAASLSSGPVCCWHGLKNAFKRSSVKSLMGLSVRLQRSAFLTSTDGNLPSLQATRCPHISTYRESSGVQRTDKREISEEINMHLCVSQWEWLSGILKFIHPVVFKAEDAVPELHLSKAQPAAPCTCLICRSAAGIFTDDIPAFRSFACRSGYAVVSIYCCSSRLGYIQGNLMSTRLQMTSLDSLFW